MEVAYGRGQRTLHLMSVYGFSGDGRLTNCHSNDELLKAVMLVAAELGEVPILIAGDLNTLPHQSATLVAARSLGRWFDVARAVV